MQTVTVIGGSLFDLALRFYGDATMWALIAKANGLDDPMLSGQVTLTVPPAVSSASGGVYAQ